MLKHPVLALIFLAATLVQGALQGFLIWALREVLFMFSGAGALILGDLVLAALAILAIWVLLSASTYLGDVISIRLAYRVEIESMWKVLAKLLTLSVRFFDRNSQSDLVMSSYYDLKGVRSVTLQVGQIALNVSRLIGLAVSAWIMSPMLAVIGLITVPLGALPTYWIGQRIIQAAKRERDALTTLYDSFYQVASGIRIIKVNESEKRILGAAQQIGQELYSQIVRQAQQRGLARFLLEAVSGVGLILVLTIGGSQVAAGELDWQSLLSMLIVVMAVYAPIVSLLQVYNTISGVIPNLDRVDRIMKTPAAIEDRPDARALSQAPNVIELRNVSFAYDDKLVLDSVSATFHKGEKIGIVGLSGAGKSTLVSILLRFYEPTQGTVLFDGQDLRDIRYSDLMQKCAIVLQEPFLTIDTVAENIRAARPDAPLEEVIRAAKAANIHDEIMQMDNGYDTLLARSAQGRGVSVGQKQRICIAAALLKNAPILFLDEATSNLDPVSEHKVQMAIERLMSGRTCLIIAHRLSTLRTADRLLVLDRGKVAGFGRHDELLDTCPAYQRLWRYQLDQAKEIEEDQGEIEEFAEEQPEGEEAAGLYRDGLLSMPAAGVQI